MKTDMHMGGPVLRDTALTMRAEAEKGLGVTMTTYDINPQNGSLMVPCTKEVGQTNAVGHENGVAIANDGYNQTAHDECTFPLRTANGSEGDDRTVKVAVCVKTANTKSNGDNVNQSGAAYTIDGTNGQAVCCFQQNQRDEVRNLGEASGALASNAGAHQTNYLAIGIGRDSLRGRPWEGDCNPTLTQANANGIGASNQELFAQNYNGLVIEEEKK